jgi:hypothetical protein
MRNTIYSAIKEMLERHWDVYQIASKLKLDPAYVQVIIDTINNIV